MDIRERIANAKSPEEMEKYLLDLDRLEEFLFTVPPTHSGEIRPVRG